MSRKLPAHVFAKRFCLLSILFAILYFAANLGRALAGGHF